MSEHWHRVYLPEIHDLYPGMHPGAEALLALLPAAARTHVAWSVVPDWQGRAPLDPAAPATRAIAALPGAKVLHGLTHSLGPDLLNWLLYGHDNRSEFRRLGRAEAAARLERAVGLFSAAFGTPPQWFCAPRWQLSRAARAELAARGFRGHLGRTGIDVYGEGWVAMPALNFDEGERAWRTTLAIRARRPLIRRLLARGTPFRLVVHPGDALHAGTAAQLRALSDALTAEGWRPVGLNEAVRLGLAAARRAA
ncbi:Predicted deacetylase [Meinhardsimonia xiamenensis]|jgi:predicted deacetylase|uniref:Predicted deacetylase n=1 Tax=Meinhardsimonia xiamenensis TaxID=990712 RepID=A0A1G9FGP7_9RHOB|nr:DUF2334 domain-containing protein [Meinhardsimonia xiamenensis]PRX37852.1 putative deacetylase [Meinhardsimonia xiamenensis]SDK87611.1 Predicted deacetylase [Meinhardsimonia xiamenensis]